MSLAQIGDNQHLHWDPKDSNIQVNFHIGEVKNLYSGTSVHGAGIGSVATEINTIRQHDPQIANALEQLFQVSEIQQYIKELTELIAKDYNQPKDKPKNRIKISSILNAIKTCGEIAIMFAPYYNIIAQKYKLPTIPVLGTP